ncbi:hypothetical protein M8818_006061 [Zalaria obscura]|uniref:Uncharacterized protein n=1 Tax=Zalaria obscura TaxID=2024903 RepID=A0ACC3S7D4_9PEZI
MKYSGVGSMRNSHKVHVFAQSTRWYEDHPGMLGHEATARARGGRSLFEEPHHTNWRNPSREAAVFRLHFRCRLLFSKRRSRSTMNPTT